mmetsp:Transcript_145953/g.254679  ORF Transcript_145953/g.254679 Transcript_145953/m.254679 type:complete len:384 (-) Transcript_145953:113-1264(-)
MITRHAVAILEHHFGNVLIALDDPQKLGALKACAPLGAVLVAAWTIYWFRKDAFPEKSAAYIILAGFSFSVTSISMHTLNKVCVGLTGAAGTVTIIQMVVAVVAIMIVQYREVLAANREQMLRWCVVPIAYAAMLNSSLFGYQYLTLSLVTVFRNLAPLVTMSVESFVMPPEHRPTVSLPIMLSLLTMVIGAFLFSYDNAQISWIGIGLVLVNSLLAIFDRLLQRRLLVLECKDLPLSACMTINNTLGVFPSLVLAGVMHEYKGFVTNAAVWTDPAVVVLLLLSGFMGLGIGFFGLMCQKAMTATSFQVLQNMSKVVVVFIGVTLFHDKVDSFSRVFGMILSLGGSLVYGLLRNGEKQKSAQDEEKKPCLESGNKLDSQKAQN